MKRRDALSKAMFEMYQRAGREVGYWGRRFIQEVERKGGTATAKRMLKPIRATRSISGFQSLVAAGRLDLSLEKLVLRPEFRQHFSREEIAMARSRLKTKSEQAQIQRRAFSYLYPDELPPGRKYQEGAVRRIQVNAFERDPRARSACIKEHGARCAVCSVDFQERYGRVGRGFIHVHHVRQLAVARVKHEVDPRKDLVPVCPNCHAMIHRHEKALTVKQLRMRVRSRSGIRGR